MTSPTDPAGDESYSAPSSDDEQDEKGDGGAETGTPFASEGGTSPGAVTDEPRERDEPQRSE
ncbi:hypothetical protein [Solicola sp. PLA-1-18]|uniref:hypothetical protein n=1 Tax=Solicola sp. PLA-1-18 TaxID=3380532 RepID=UPI003B80A55F